MCINKDVGGCCSYTGAVTLAHEGKVSRENRTRPQLLMARLMQPMPMMFITTPVLACRGHSGRGRGGYDDRMNQNDYFFPTGRNEELTMSDTLRKPEENTMALGGVATGSMKAKEALRVQGIITYRGFKLMDWDWVGKRTTESSTLPINWLQWLFFLLHFNTSCSDVS